MIFNVRAQKPSAKLLFAISNVIKNNGIEGDSCDEKCDREEYPASNLGPPPSSFDKLLSTSDASVLCPGPHSCLWEPHKEASWGCESTHPSLDTHSVEALFHLACDSVLGLQGAVLIFRVAPNLLFGVLSVTTDLDWNLNYEPIAIGIAIEGEVLLVWVCICNSENTFAFPYRCQSEDLLSKGSVKTRII